MGLGSLDRTSMTQRGISLLLGRRSAGRSVAICFGIVALLVIPTYSLATTPATAPDKSKIAEFRSHISHIVFLMQENHAYDDLFGVYCLVAGTYCSRAANGIPSGVCDPVSLKNPLFGCV